MQIKPQIDCSLALKSSERGRGFGVHSKLEYERRMSEEGSGAQMDELTRDEIHESKGQS